MVHFSVILMGFSNIFLNGFQRITFLDPNFLSLYYFTVLMGSKKKLGPPDHILFFINNFLIFQSRAAIVAHIFLIFAQNVRSHIFLFFLVIVISISQNLLTLSSNFMSNFSSIDTVSASSNSVDRISNVSDTSNYRRLISSVNALEHIFDNPLRPNYEEFMKYAPFGIMPHNWALHAGVIGGIPFIFILLMFMLYAFVRSPRSYVLFLCFSIVMCSFLNFYALIFSLMSFAMLRRFYT